MATDELAYLKQAIDRWVVAREGDAAGMWSAMQASAAHLRSLRGKPGFEAAVIAERDAIALDFGVKAVRAGDRADEETTNVALDIALAALMRV